MPLGDNTPLPEDVSEYIRASSSSRQPSRVVWTGRRKNGEEFFGDVSLNVIQERHQQLVLAAITDVTLQRLAERALRSEVAERRNAQQRLSRLNTELESRVAERTEELVLVNRELVEFSRVASHDLQAPLRKQRMFIDVLRTALPTELMNDDLKMAMNAIESSSLRMQRLIQGLLALARARNRGLKMASTSLDSVLDDALEVLSLRIEETSAVIRRESMPTLYCDRVLLSLVFQNLLENAMKFQDRNQPAIDIWSEHFGDTIEVHVSDNGIGVSKDAWDRVFEPFRRLNSESLYPGSGIGLSICRKVVERHGGTIRLTGEPGAGAHFVITLPCNGRYFENDKERDAASKSVAH